MASFELFFAPTWARFIPSGFLTVNANSDAWAEAACYYSFHIRVVFPRLFDVTEDVERNRAAGERSQHHPLVGLAPVLLCQGYRGELVFENIRLYRMRRHWKTDEGHALMVSRQR